ncbi:MAG: hypothetical protein HQL19_01155 [Candidatus Omnitrophica bacterium]|nr:hypothetical protein [Candidatus Omnitrophota bacterium]
MKRNAISFLVTPEEFKFLAGVQHLEPGICETLDKAKAEEGGLRLRFDYEDLDDCLGALAFEVNHTTADKKESRLHVLCERLEGYARLRDHVRRHGRPVMAKKDAAKFAVSVFEVRMLQHPSEGVDVVRTIAVSSYRSLYHLAEAVIKSVGFKLDHCFAFYGDMDAKPSSKQSEIYELFVDIGEEASGPHAKGVKNVQIGAAFSAVGKKMLFRFDYGDDWRFSVELKDIRAIEPGQRLPIILKRVGKAPKQYPPCKD